MLRGKPRRETIEVDPTGRQVGDPVTIDARTVGQQRATSRSTRRCSASPRSRSPQGILSARRLQNTDRANERLRDFKAPAGAVVVLDADNGSVVADASYPTYPPELVGRRDQPRSTTRRSPRTASDNPLLNRATQGQYAPGSTFKLVTSLAMTKTAIRGIGDYYTDTGSVRARAAPIFHNANDEVFGPVEPRAGAHRVERHVLLHGRQRVLEGLEARRHEARARHPTRSARARLRRRDRHRARRVRPAGCPIRRGSEGLRARQLQDQDGAGQQNSTWYPDDDIFPAVGQGDLVVDAAATRQRVRRVRERRHVVAAAHRRRASSTRRRARSSTRSSPKAIRHIDFDPTDARDDAWPGSRARSIEPEGHRVRRVPGLPARAVPDRGQDRYRAGRRARATRRCSSAIFGGATGTAVRRRSSWSSRPASARRPRRRSCAAIIESMNGLSPTPPVVGRSTRATTDGRADGALARRARGATPIRCCSRCRSRSAALGLLMIYSSSQTRLASQGMSQLYYVERQSLAIVLGVIAMAVVLAIDYRRMRDLWPLVYLAVLPLLIGVLVIGQRAQGRAGVVPGRARCSSSRRRSPRSWWSSRSPATAISIATISTPAASPSRSRIAGFAMALVFLQHDLGTTLVILVCSFAVLVVAGLQPVAHRRARADRRHARGRRGRDRQGRAYRVDRIVGFLDQSTSDQTASKQTQAAVQPDRVEDRDRQRRLRGRGAVQGPPDQPRLRARAAHRLHLHGGGRGARLPRRRDADRPLRLARVAGVANRPAVVRLLRHAARGRRARRSSRSRCSRTSA